MVLAKSLTSDNSEEFDLFKQTQSGENNLIEQFDYVMHGKIFEDKLSDDKTNLTVYLSFGGLLMSIQGKYEHLKKLEMDSRIYLLLK